jgi:lantibiotic modifying enzyme
MTLSQVRRVLAKNCRLAERTQRADGWRDARYPSNEERISKGWCNGAVGIGLAYYSLSRSVDQPWILDGLRLARTQVFASVPEPVDGLCCGECGKVDYLFTMAEIEKQPKLKKNARNRIDTMMSNARIRGPYRPMYAVAVDPGMFGIFQGIAGTGYTLLRCVNRGLPSFLDLTKDAEPPYEHRLS